MRLLDRVTRAAHSEPTMTQAQTVLMQSYRDGSVERLAEDFRSYAELGYKGNGIIFALILKRLMLFSEATFKYQSLTDEHLFGTTDLSIIENPWPGGTTRELLARMEQDVSLAGNAFIRHAGDRLERLRPDRVTIVLGERDDESLEVIGYSYNRRGVGGGMDPTWSFYPVDEVAHWSPIPDPLAEYRGMSWLTPVVREINADIAMTTHKSKFFDNAATPNLLVKYQRKLGKDQVDFVREQLNLRHVGSENAWKTMILDEGADVTVLGQSFEQMAFTAVQAAGENRIAVAAGVPAIVAGLKEGNDASTYSNYAQAMRAMADLFGRPQWGSAAACLAKLVPVQPDARLWYDTSDIGALREGEKDRAEANQINALAAGELIRAGYDPQTVTQAVISGDFSLLKHSGAIPTALYPDGKAPTGGTP